VDVSQEMKERMTREYGAEAVEEGIRQSEEMYEEAEKVLKTSFDSPTEDQLAEYRDWIKRLLCATWIHDRIMRAQTRDFKNLYDRVNNLEAEMRSLRYRVADLKDPVGREPVEDLLADPDLTSGLNSILREQRQARANNS